jgi:hypothetical protein
MLLFHNRVLRDACANRGDWGQSVACSIPGVPAITDYLMWFTTVSVLPEYLGLGALAPHVSVVTPERVMSWRDRSRTPKVVALWAALRAHGVRVWDAVIVLGHWAVTGQIPEQWQPAETFLYAWGADVVLNSDRVQAAAVRSMLDQLDISYPPDALPLN